MANDLVTADSVLVSVPHADSNLAPRMEWIMSGSYRSGGALCLLNMPSPEDRRAIVMRRDYLVKSMHHDPDKVGLLVTRMLQGFRARFNEPVDGMKLANDVRLFQRELAIEPAVPTWAVALACNSVRMGTTDGKTWQEPTTATLRRMCDKKAWEVKAQITTLSAVLQAQRAAPLQSEDDRKAIGDKFRALHTEMVERPNPIPDHFSYGTNDLISMAGGVGAWDKIPDAPARMASAVALGREADRLASEANERVRARMQGRAKARERAAAKA